MPFDSEGIFTRVHNWEDDREADIDIMSTRMDEEDDNFAAGLSNCMLRDGRSTMRGDLKMGNFKVKNIADGTLPTDAVNKSQLDKQAADASENLKKYANRMWQVGDIKTSLLFENHNNWFLCNGQEVSRVEYSELFSVIGTNFGAGDGTTTFNLPDYRGKFLRGLGGNSAADIYTAQAEGLPNITGSIEFVLQRQQNKGADGAFKMTTSGSNGGDYTSVGPYAKFDFDAKRSNEIYGASEHVTPENYAVNFFIKVKSEE